eukprot:TRINITY_DN256_c0_g1_i1.p1 TRINITY_DN256_c0_g1~~TRINITY_DN256_c0_g1_i1.p1  ORF type:complete len:240 (-),score=65.30 TRINITY_DN256_c0_g1_i1:36-755(-)
MAAKPKAWLEICIGDKEKYKVELEAHERAKAFVKACGSSYGYSSNDLTALLANNDPALEGLEELYNANPEWRKKGEMRLEEPPSLVAGRVVIDLFWDKCPKTVENFKCLCTGEKGKGKSGKVLHYQNTPFHRLEKNFVLQGGDVVRGDGSSGDSIYGGKFNDEKNGLALKHSAIGVVSMANSGKNTNTSQFFFTLSGPFPQLDGKHVVFGQVVEGIDALKKVNEVSEGTPIFIGNCGIC